MLCGNDYISYSLDLSAENECSIPITNDITEFVGNHEMYIRITSGDIIIGKTNSVNLRVYPFNGLCEEIVKREVYIARIEELESRIAADNSDFNDIKNAISVTTPVSDHTPTSEYGALVRTIPGIVLSDSKNVIEGELSGTYRIPYVRKISDYCFYHSNIRGFTIPDSVTYLGTYCFGYCDNITSITIPDSVVSMGTETFFYCGSLSSVSIGSGLTSITYRSFAGCRGLQSIYIPQNILTIEMQAFIETNLNSVSIAHGLQSIKLAAFSGVSTLSTLTLPNTLTNIENLVFSGCNNLTSVTIENGFNANNLDLSASTKYSASTIAGWLNALADRTGETAYTLKMGTTNLNKLTNEQKAIAINKNWNLS